MAKSGSALEHSGTAGDFVGIQPELLSSKYQRKTKLLKSIAKRSLSADQETGGSTVLVEKSGPLASNSGSNLTMSDSSTSQPHETKEAMEVNSVDGSKTSDATSAPDSMRDESHLTASEEESHPQSSEPQPALPLISPAIDISTAITTPRQMSPSTELKSQSSPPVNLTHDDVDTNDLPHLSAADLNRAKNLVLDLLGWGVQPEYLLSAGLSHELAFRVFADLNLRMPTNLKITDTLMDVAYSLGRDDMGSGSSQQL